MSGMTYEAAHLGLTYLALRLTERIKDRGLGPTESERAQLRETYPDHALFFRIGPFYVAFDEDAEELDRLAGVPAYDDGRGAIVCFPETSGGYYAGRLVESGRKVVVLDPAERPKGEEA